MYQTIRGEVMEKGVAIEAGISGILGYILNIDAETSKSLGHQNIALSLNAKVNLLTDLKFVPKEISKQFQIFAEIRNKFAHVQQVDNFSKCFEIQSLKEKKNYFLETFATPAPEEFGDEAKLSMSFTRLCFHLGMWMNLILERSKYFKVQELNKTAVVEMLRVYLGSMVPEKGSAQEQQYLDHIDLLLQDVEQDKEFMASVVEAVNAGEKQEEIRPEV